MSLAHVHMRMAAACERAGRALTDVKLIAVTKGHAVAEINEQLVSKGQLALGENRIQEWREKASAFAKMPTGIDWHMIGSLQTNKVKYCQGFSLIHSLNSERLAEALEAYGEKHQHRFKTLIEVNAASELTKQGVALKDVKALLGYTQSLSYVEVLGLMTMAPYTEPEQVRGVFRQLRHLGESLGLRELSMGMSNDFEVAIEEGATILRVGSAIFES